MAGRRPPPLAATWLACAAALLVAGCAGSGDTGGPARPTAGPTRHTGGASLATGAASRSATGSPAAPGLPTPAHVVVVVFENHSYSDIVGSPDAPRLNALAQGGAVFTQSFALTHPSQPNYVALFSGSTQGLTDDSCPHNVDAPNLATVLQDAGKTFRGYSEGLPSNSFRACRDGAYVRKHAPWVDFPALPAGANAPFGDFPTDFTRLPDVAFVIPDLDHDMHDGSVADGDQWFGLNLGAYAAWARGHDSLLVVTFDEDDRGESNQIPTVIAGARVRAGRYAEHLDHYGLLRTIEALEGTTPVGASARRSPVTDVWAQ